MPKPPSPKPGSLSRYQTFETATVHRRQLKGAAYNPRRIDDHAKAKLRANLKRVGLIQPLIWNKRTGNLVGGHQRVDLLDSLEGSDDYSLTVAVVDLDEKTEREQNVALNNTSAMGTWDEEALTEMLKADESVRIDIGNAGFDLVDIEVLVDDPEVLKFFAPVEEDEPASAVLTEVEAAAAAKKAERLAAHKAARTVPAIKDRRREYKAADQENHDSEFYAVVVFENRDAREAFMARMGVDPADRYVDGARVTANLAPPAGPPA